MRTNHYYKEVFQPDVSTYKKIHFFLAILSIFPKMWIQVFIRKNFGERYFSFGGAVFLTLVMLFLPSIFPPPERTSLEHKIYNMPLMFPGWYAFTVAFFIMSYKRWKEIEVSVSSFDFGKYSLYSGDILPFFANIARQNNAINFRKLEVWIEPGAFFVIGIVLSPFTYVGYALIIASVLLWATTSVEYFLGDQFMLNKIDEMIVNESFQETFMGDDSEWSPKSGVRFKGRKPSSDENRKKVLDAIYVDDDDDELAK